MNDPEIILTTDRTAVRRIDTEHAGFFYTLMNTPGWLRYIGDRSIDNARAAEDHIREGYLKSYDQNGFGYYVIEDRRIRHPIGICGFLKRPELHNPDFGFAMLPTAEGRGLAEEACSAVLAYGAKRYQLDVVDAITQLDNEKARRLLERLSFRAIDLNHPHGDEKGLALYQWVRDHLHAT